MWVPAVVRCFATNSYVIFYLGFSSIYMVKFCKTTQSLIHKSSIQIISVYSSEAIECTDHISPKS